MSTNVTPVKKPTHLQKPSPSTATTKGTNVSPVKSHHGGNYLSPKKVHEIPIEHDAKYTISYVPGMVEHEINTCNNHEEAKIRIVQLACELERVNTYNYSLVRENEVLRVQANKSEREKDLETKLAIVLAENEKLNQIIEEVYEVYMSTRHHGDNHEYEAHLHEVLEDLEEWKHKYKDLENSTNVVELQNQLKDLHHERDHLSEQLARKDRDLEAMRARIAPLEGNMANSSELQHRVNALSAENGHLHREVDALKLKHGNADALQLRIADYDNKIRTVLAENEKLNDYLVAKAKEVKELKDQLALQSHSNSRVHDYSLHVSQQLDEHRKNTQVASNANAERLQSLIKENEELRHEVAHLRECEGQIRILRDESSRLHTLLIEKEKEIHLLQANNQSYEHKAAIERLSVKVQELIHQNESLNRIVESKNAEVNNLYIKIRELEAKPHVDESANIRVHILTDENNKLRDQLEHKKHELEELYHRCAELNQSTLIISEHKEKVVLLTKENERLNNLLHGKFEEVEGLKRSVAHHESSKVNTDHYEDRIRVLISENQRFAELHRTQTTEIDNLKHTIYQLQADAHQNDDLRMKLALVSTENERLSRDIEELRRKLRDDQSESLKIQISYLNSEKQKLEAIIADKDRELHHLRDDHVRVIDSHAQELHRERETVKNAGIDQRRKIGELEGRISQLMNLETKITVLSMEVEKLHKDVVERENHIHHLSQSLGDREREVAELKIKLGNLESQRQYESSELRTRIQVELESKFAGIRHDLESQIQRLTIEKRDAEDKARYATMEFERFQTLIRDMKVEIDDWKTRYYQLQNSSDHEVEELRRQFEGLKVLTLQAKELQQKFSAERTAYETQLLQMSQTVSDLEHQIQYLSSENERMTNLNIQRLHVIEELKHNSNEDAHRLEVHELRTQLEQLKSNSYDVKQLALQYSSEKGTLQSKISELTQLNNNYKGDISELRSLLEKRKTDVESLNKQNEELRKLAEKLNYQRQSTSSSGHAENLELLQIKVAELEMSRNDYQRQAERNSVELTRKNRELVDKIQELDVLKLKYEEGLANYQALNNQMFSRLSVRK